jgi:DNA-binding beta-propeller fold protein YncE
MRGQTIRVLATLAIGLFACALTASAAQAAESRILSDSFGSFNEPLGVAVDNSTNPADPAAGDVYVVDTGGHRVVRFDGSGAPADFSASGSNIVGNVLTGTQGSPFSTPAWAAVDPANGDFYVTDLSGGAVYKFDPTGALIATITAASSGLNVGTTGSFNPGGIAVDPTNGNVWLSNQGYHDSSTYSVYSQIAELDSSGKVIEGAGFIANHNRNCECSSVKGLAVNSAHHVYVADVEPPTVIEYNSVGEELGTVDTNGPTAVAVDPSNDHVFVAETSPERVITEFDPAGSPIEVFGANSVGVSYGLGIDASHDVYVADHANGSEVAKFILTTPPDVTTNPADDVTAHYARLNGAIDPAGNGEITGCHFKYGTTKSYSLGSVPCEQGTHFSSSTRVTADIPAVSPSTTYHFRLFASNATVTAPGADESFTTPSATRNPTASFATSSEPIAVGVDNSSEPSHGSVYVVGFGNDVEKFSKEGAPTNFSELGSPILTGFSNPPTAVAVDPSNGDFYVVDEGDHKVTKYAPSGKSAEFSDKVDSYVSGNVLSGTGSGTFEPFGIAVDSAGNLYVSNHATKAVDKFDSTGHFLLSFNGGGEYPFGGGPYSYGPDALAVDSSGNVYVVAGRYGEVVKVSSSGVPVPVDGVPGHTAILASGGAQSVAVDPSNGETFVFNGNTQNVSAYNSAGTLTNTIGFGGQSSYGIAVYGVTHELYVANINDGSVDIYPPIGGSPLPDVGTGNASAVTRTSATLSGIVDPAGTGKITECYFEVSEEPNVPCDQPTPFSGTTEVTGAISELSHGNAYDYHLVATSETGGTNTGQDVSFTALPNPPSFTGFSVSSVHADSALLGVEINPGGGKTTYRFEYGPADCSTNPCTSFPTPDGHAGSSFFYQGFSAHLFGLSAETEYHWRVVATNAFETTASPDHTFTTFPSGGLHTDPCANAHVRQQSGASFLPDCRAYELVSAANTGGYAVESSLVEGQTPFGGYPDASGGSGPSRALYAVHYGGIPGVGDPTNKGDDPYVATRGNDGWSTGYAGIPASTTPSILPFASTMGEADPSLDAFAFAGEGICSPCFADGSTGIPLHLPDGSLVQGMAGSVNPGPSAKPAGYVGKHFSADGTHFIFGSTSRFEPDGNSNGDISIYDRNLSTGQTHVVSKTPGEATMTGSGIAELDISGNGSRVVIGKLVGTDSKGNNYYHLYMNIGDSTKTIDLTPGATDGVLYDGMTTDGSKVFFTTKDQLEADTDTSADIYRADVSESGATLTRISAGIGAAGNTDSCTPASNWNTVSGGPNCNAVAIGGGGGVGSGDGTIYFFSPELLDGPSNGSAGQPNLYVVRPTGAPHYVTTLETTNPAVIDAVQAAGIRHTGDFEVNPSGNDAVFTTELPLKSGYNNVGHTEVYRYSAVDGQLDCASCNPTNADAAGDASLAEDGLSLTNDGRVFFDSSDALAPRDLDGRIDVYEWSDGKVGLISTGTSSFDAKLLSASADGTDAFFFTRDTLVVQDENGILAKLYDARELGGFPFIPPPPPCKASDECHGPSSQAAPAPNIGTFKGSGGNAAAPKKHHRRHHHRHHTRHKAHRHG